MKRTPVIWEQVRDRLRASEAALEEALTESPERIERAYRRRALALANRQAGPELASASLAVLVFWLRQERYAIELKELREVLPFTECTAVPGAPPAFRGVIGLRGELRAVVDLGRMVLDSEDASVEPGPAGSGVVLMLRRPGREIGLRIDRVEELRELRPDELGRPPQGKYATGITGDMLMLLDVDKILADLSSKEGSVTA